MQTEISNDSAIQRAIDFLGKNNALEVNASPWGSYEDDEVVSQVDYDRIMDNSSRENRRMQVPPDFEDDIHSALGDGDLDRRILDPRPQVESATPVSWDTCAWYQPFHYFAQGWGIYVREECLLRLAIRIAQHTDNAQFQAEKLKEITKKMTSGSAQTCWRLTDAEIFIRAAFIALFLHEHYHHRVECLGLRLHVVTRTPLYVPYNKTVYMPSKGSDDLLEEALANACMYLRLSEQTYRKLLPTSVRDAMKAMLKAMFPHEQPGYRMAINYLDQPSFDAGENRLQAFVRETSLHPVQPTHEWDCAPRLTQSFFNIKSSIYVVVPMGTKSVLPTNALPLSCSTEQMIRICRKKGYEINKTAGKGSHIKLEKDGAAPVILPHRKDLSIGVLKNTLATIGTNKLADLPRLLKL